MKNYIKITLILSILLSGCGKEFLDEKRDKTLVVPPSIPDLQALLDDATVTMNTGSGHELGLIGADEIILSYEIWRDIPNKPFEKKGYVWAKNVYEGNSVNDWDKAYRRILFANTAYSGIEKIIPGSSNQMDWNNVKGAALFFRAYNFYQLAQLFSKPYDQATADNDLGIPLRLDPDITMKTDRGNNKQVYEQIVKDLTIAAELLPQTGINVYRPAKPAAFALLAKVYLQMKDYENARINAEKCLKIRNVLNDLNTLNLNTSYTFPTLGTNNPEVIFLSYMTNISIVTTTRINVSPEVLALYTSNDLRTKAYFRAGTNGRTLFKGS
jgi:tetratricopeptide (TPR) repeat protein